MKDIVVIGAGGLGREVVDVLTDINKKENTYNILGYIDDDESKHGKILNGYPVLGGFSWFNNIDTSKISAVHGIGSPPIRKKLINKAKELGIKFETIIHPSVVMSEDVKIGEGAIITAGNIITNNIVIGDFCYINLDCTVGHDAILGDFTNINPGVHISGGVIIGEGTEVGTGAVIIQYVKIGEWSIIGAGAVVTKDLPSNVTAVGVPAKIIKQREPGWQENI